MKADKIPSKSAVSEFYDLEKRLTLTEEEHTNLNNLMIRYDAIKNRYVNQYDDVISLKKIANKFNISPGKLRYAVKKKKLPLKKAIAEISKNKQSLSELARKHDIPYPALYARINYYGYTLEEALTLPLRSYRRGKKEGKNGK